MERRRRTSVSPDQLTFCSGDRFEALPGLNERYGPITNFLNKQPMWGLYYQGLRSKRKRECLLVELEPGMGIFFSPYSWQEKDRSPLGQLASKRLDGLVMVSKTGRLEDLLILEKLSQGLDYQSPVYVFEENPSGDPEARVSLLGEANFVERQVLTRPNIPSWPQGKPILVSRARKAKKRNHPAVDLLDPNHPEYESRRNWYNAIAREVMEGYHEAGYKVVGWEEIKKAFTETRNPLETIRRLRQGFGVVIQSESCRCQWEIDLKGTITKVRECDSGCLPVTLERQEASRSEHKAEDLGVCWDCLSPMKLNPNYPEKSGVRLVCTTPWKHK